MKCEEYGEALMAALATFDEHSPDLEAHEKVCPGCRERGRSMRVALDSISKLEAPVPARLASGTWTAVSAAQPTWAVPTPPFWERLLSGLASRLPAPALAGAACAILIVLVAVSWIHRSLREPSTQIARVIEQSPGLTIREERGSTKFLLPGRGTTRLEHGAGVTLAAAGPLRLELTSESIARLDEGTVAFEVDRGRRQGSTYQVVTPHLKARVTGTRFTVQVFFSQTQVELATGTLDVSSGGSDASMTAGQTVRTDGTTLSFVTRSSAAVATTTNSTASPVTRPNRPEISESEAPSAARPSGSVPIPGQRVRGSDRGEPVAPPAPDANVHEPYRPRDDR